VYDKKKRLVEGGIFVVERCPKCAGKGHVLIERGSDEAKE
jgi:hypothetical protein